MTASAHSPVKHFLGYSQRLSDILLGFDWSPVAKLAEDLRACWQTERQVFLCGNGGSAGTLSKTSAGYSPIGLVCPSMMAVNVRGVWLGLKYVMTAMEKTGGSIVITSSTTTCRSPRTRRRSSAT